jgi:REP element-mobilizing transposase RayT
MKNTDPLYPDSFYHVYSHAVDPEKLFRTDDNCRYFLKKYTQYISPVCQTFAYCLMPNHFHFLIRVRSEKELRKSQKAQKPDMDWNARDFVMQQFSNFLNAYAKAYNKKYNRRGALFVDYLRRKTISSDRYLLNVIHYIHFNPVHHGYCNDLNDWTFTSYHALRSRRPTYLDRKNVIDLFGDLNSFDKFHQKMPEKKLEKELED